MPQPRIRMFAGPNGSGKSTVKDYLLPHHIGAYLNADDLESHLRADQQLDLSSYHSALVEFLQQAQQQGFKTYLYYVSTVDPMINIARVKYRVSMGGHTVPEQKIIERYYRSMDLLMQAVDASDRSYLFDNSSNGEKAAFIAEIQSAETLKMNPEIQQLPWWFAEKVLKNFITE